ncbi:GT-D fold domain-containing glycosyltransferase [Acinetobacter portensis]|uniref:GT-D fold domain-containing glycosyltransferase n=1 Tax=Acinetobacter portensis TaxID=1839785 RepID=A0ABY4JVN1_9GAMM|nr:GT-D fold domain-containing glycosyltransferase [Acinetobacter portensis]MCK7607976.1 GT-D fold domain-containing glycosyltransferase [Acinetobacter portensis]MCK7638737.1 GT-D fold domain-containing glycosyltransferase [Acinetobacter portensis]UPO23498.1 GT-D fold domain-containing glycosyltransferase [Acinetobacter portensis]
MNKILKKILNIIDYINVGSFIFISEEISTFEKNKIYDLKQTLDLVYENELSLVRFGDGEINHCLYSHISSDWQEGSAALSDELSSILIGTNDKILVCIPAANLYSRWWKRYWINNWYPFKQKISLTKKYGNSFITRPEFFLAYKYDGVGFWQRIWEDKEVVFITGEGSRFNYNHELFSNIKSYETLLSRSKNAYSDLNRLVNLVNMECNKEKLFIIALGQSGTVLAYRLQLLGYRALDIGHIDRSYDYVFKNGQLPEDVSYK